MCVCTLVSLSSQVDHWVNKKKKMMKKKRSGEREWKWVCDWVSEEYESKQLKVRLIMHALFSFRKKRERKRRRKFREKGKDEEEKKWNKTDTGAFERPVRRATSCNKSSINLTCLLLSLINTSSKQRRLKKRYTHVYTIERTRVCNMG